MDTKLFELCKEVYEKTGWRDWSFMSLDSTGNLNSEQGLKGLWDRKDFAPLYTSDYLLEKLPNIIKDATLTMGCGDEGYGFGYMHSHAETRNSKTLWVQRVDYKAIADTPLKALLKLTLALAKAGEIV